MTAANGKQTEVKSGRAWSAMEPAFRHCERSEAIQGNLRSALRLLDCFVATLLAMTAE
jgi:hypothetical protein